MNFETFKSRIKASAVAATEAARSFQTLDQLAAQDDYIHSEGLRTKSSSSTKIKTKGETESLNQSNNNRNNNKGKNSSHDHGNGNDGDIGNRTAPGYAVMRSSSSASSEPIDNEDNRNERWMQQQQQQQQQQQRQNPQQPQQQQKRRQQQRQQQHASPLLDVVASLVNNDGGVEASSSPQHVEGKPRLYPMEFESGRGGYGRGHLFLTTTKEQDVNEKNGPPSSVPEEDDDDDDDDQDSHDDPEASRSKRRKNPNRFMEDLEERLSKVEEDGSIFSTASSRETPRASGMVSPSSSSRPLTPPPPPASTPATTMGKTPSRGNYNDDNENNNNNNNPNNNPNNRFTMMMQSMTKTRLGQIVVEASSSAGGLLSPLVNNNNNANINKHMTQQGIHGNATNAHRPSPKTGLLARRDEEEELEGLLESHETTVLNSASVVLGSDEQAELERLGLATRASPLSVVMETICSCAASEKANPLLMILSLVKQHPHHAFIIFTLVLGSAVYFYTRHRGNEDDVS